jgi:hypothetical protein
VALFDGHHVPEPGAVHRLHRGAEHVEAGDEVTDRNRRKRLEGEGRCREQSGRREFDVGRDHGVLPFGSIKERRVYSLPFYRDNRAQL